MVAIIYHATRSCFDQVQERASSRDAWVLRVISRILWIVAEVDILRRRKFSGGGIASWISVLGN